MAFYRPYQLVNRGGSAYIESVGVTVGTDNVVFTFPRVGYFSQYRGVVYVKLAQAIPAGTTTTLPIVFDTTPVTAANGTAVTVANIGNAANGVYAFWYDSFTNVLQQLTFNAPA